MPKGMKHHNYCTKCESYYRDPGTCNCYAPAVSFQYLPNYYPYWQPYYPYGTITVSDGISTGGSGCATVTNADVPTTFTGPEFVTGMSVVQ